MRCASSIQSRGAILDSLHAAMDEANERLNSQPDCAIVFLSSITDSIEASRILSKLQLAYPSATIVGGAVGSVIGSNRELEGSTAASVLLITDMTSKPRVIHLECVKTPDGLSVLGIDDDMIASSLECNGLVVSACPHTFSMERLFESLSDASISSKTVKVIGGHISSKPSELKSHSESCFLFRGDRVVDRGAVGLVMPSGYRWETLVSHGCRPVGEPMVVTDVKDYMITGLGGRPALQRLRSLFDELPNQEQKMALELLLIGRAASEYSEQFSHGEFLIRNITGIDQDLGAIFVSDRFRVGQTIRFHLHDPQAASADFDQQLSELSQSPTKPEASLLFSCNGRGIRMFEREHHDASAIERYFPGLPLAGYFAAGEFGPIAQMNFVHGFTAVAAFLKEDE